MKAQELIAALKTLPPDCEVFVWLDDGDRLPVVSVDASPEFVQDGFADLMVNERGTQ